MKIEDHILFFKEIIGSMRQSEIVDYEKVRDYFKGALITTIKTSLANKIVHEKISALEISTELQKISNDIKEKVTEQFSQYGFTLVNFHIQSINFPDEDFEQINHILQDKAKFEIMGDHRYVTQRSFDVYEKAASNSNGVAGAFAAGGIGLSAGMNIANSASQHVQTPGSNNKTCPSCHASVVATSKFCNNCGESLQSTNITCYNCQQENLENSKFCSSCGTSLRKLVCECGNELERLDKFCNNCGKAQNN